MIKLMLVDDHAMFRQGLRRQCETCRDIEVVGEAHSAAQLRERLPEAKPDVMILDVKLPDADGTSLIPTIKAACPRCRVVILTMHDHVRYAVHAMEQGADGFVLKDALFQDLLDAVRTVAQGKTYVSQETANLLAARLRHNTRRTPADTLSAREFEVLVHLGRRLSAKLAADALGVSPKTVNTYKSRLMRKLNLASQADLLRYALESGVVK